MPITHISVRGAREHNLRDINVRIPRNTLTVVTGLSGSGKSSLAFDTIYAEGQRRYVETLSAYARQFLDQIERPDVDSIEGLSPAISIEQKPPAVVPGPPWVQLRKSTTTSACSTHRLECLTARSAANQFRASPRNKLWNAFFRLPLENASSSTPRSFAAARASSRTFSMNWINRAFAPASTARCATSPIPFNLNATRNTPLKPLSIA